MSDDDDLGDTEFMCEFCRKNKRTLYEGWFRTAAASNPFAQGTASAGVLQRRRACRQCAEEAIASGLSLASSIPEGE